MNEFEFLLIIGVAGLVFGLIGWIAGDRVSNKLRCPRCDEWHSECHCDDID